MIWNRCLSALVGLTFVLLFGGCETPVPGEKFSCVDDVIRIGDSLKLSLSTPGETGGTTDKDLLVGSDGTVNLYLLGSTKAAGVKFSDFEKTVQQEYIAKKFYRQVTVTVKPGERFYTVAGEVKAPGRQIYIGQTTVLRAIAVCGDFNEFANRRRVEINRADGRRETMDCKKAINDSKFDRPLCPGDHINVPRSL